MTDARGAAHWDARYASTTWLTEPSSTVADALEHLPPGRALDLATGTGRHARWLVARGWDVTGVDFSKVGIEQATADVPEAAFVVADLAEWQPGTTYDLVLAAYVQLGVDGWRRVGSWVAPGGRLVVVGDALRNLTDGVHGPRDPARLHTEQGLRDGADGLVVERLQEVLRPDEGGTAIDLVLVARRP